MAGRREFEDQGDQGDLEMHGRRPEPKDRGSQEGPRLRHSQRPDPQRDGRDRQQRELRVLKAPRVGGGPESPVLGK